MPPRTAKARSVKDELAAHRLHRRPRSPATTRSARYFETHIEQGPVLEDHDKTIGVVTGVLGIRWYDCTVTGMEAHAGPTPMALRKDALQVATQLMQEVVACAHRHPPHGRGTVGMVQVFPNSRNVIPGRVQVQHRPAQRQRRAVRRDGRRHPRAWRRKLSAETRPADRRSSRSRPTRRSRSTPTASARWRARPSSSATATCRRVSGAGHDAVYMARLAPAGMIFIPCKDGISHNEIEDAKPEHITAGCNVLLHAMLERAGVAP